MRNGPGGSNAALAGGEAGRQFEVRGPRRPRRGYSGPSGGVPGESPAGAEPADPSGVGHPRPSGGEPGGGTAGLDPADLGPKPGLGRVPWTAGAGPGTGGHNVITRTSVVVAPRIVLHRFASQLTCRLPLGGQILSTRLDRRAAERALTALPDSDGTIWSDGPTDGGTTNGGGVAVVIQPCEERAIKWLTAVGALCSSARAELLAFRLAVKKVAEFPSTSAENVRDVRLCTDSRACLRTLQHGPNVQPAVVV